ncbi:BREX-5 system adenine-specific DNA-methyltransferase PglX [Haloarcula sp. CBA1122]|uniref:BREX-5 system adenine-specific DNA-methyltransferase PglX n=1 Tax=Haloarcula sp. CBA1122 TaxID=2668069 RepID=UPI001306EC65|nr:BREX-5 system adenine-specific DNA-methyltransferase PglX [Haloarcula sp. CBA1122]MUV48485.1 BREX-5 system adenine-specific DNA-methyltransferase PglX [Haloarcula sp. CBA1122]
MDGQSTHPRKAQLDKEEREHLEAVVTEMRDRVEANVRYQLEDEYGLDEKPDTVGASSGEPAPADAREDGDASLSETQENLVEAIELEAADGHDWEAAHEQYITGVGYTIVNRLAALRCMEVRDFIDDEVTSFRDDGLTPAADRLVTEEFMLEEEAVLEAYRNECDALADEIEILFDRSTAYSQIDPDDDTYEDLCGMLDEVPDEVWRADDVLGWVYEYYNVKLLDDLRRKGDREGLEPEDVPAANQFYTPHWVVRMLTDNSLGKLYLEDNGTLQETVEAQDALTPDERKNRPLSPDESPDLADFCTYLVPSEEEGEPPAFDGPEDIRVIDPACGSGHFLLYAFDVLERIWRAETDLDHAEIPREILRHNLHGVDLDMRACQLAAFNLYLKGRTRAEAEGATGFDMPEVGIVCADAKVADIEGVEEVFDEVADGKDDVENALRRILDAFEEVHGLGSLLDVRGTLGELFEDGIDQESVQITLEDDPTEHHTLGQILHSLREAVDEHREEDSFLAQDLRSFVRLLDVLAQDYDVALMNPPYGSVNRMPDSVTKYVNDRYDYFAEFYINFFEVCDKISKENGRIGMLVPRTFMFKNRFETFRHDFVGSRGSFDFLAEYGIGVLDNATVRTAGTVVRSGAEQEQSGTFIRLHDVSSEAKETVFTNSLSNVETDIRRLYQVDLNEFDNIPGKSLSYYIPKEVRELHETDFKIDAEQAEIGNQSIGKARQGLTTANDQRFVRKHWEVANFDSFKPLAMGGETTWIVPQVSDVVEWGNNGVPVKRSPGSFRTRNEDLYGKKGLTWAFIKEKGRRFGIFPSGGVYNNSGCMLIPEEGMSNLKILAIVNSTLYHNLILSITPERNWQAGEIGGLPWIEDLEEIEELEELSKKQYQVAIQQRLHNPISPYYTGPQLLPSAEYEPFYSHPHTEKIESNDDISEKTQSSDCKIVKSANRNKRRELELRHELESLSDSIDRQIFDYLDFNHRLRHELKDEIFLRTSEDPEDREVPDPESVPEVPDNLDEQVKDLVHHFAMEAVREESDGIIPLEGADEQADMLDRIVERFEDAYGEYAEDRLVEVDDILGAESAADEAYPNLRAFVEDDLFAYHVDTMENTPILWKLSTARLLADAESEGFACFVDYHQLDASLFDRLGNTYLEPRKSALRDRQAAANQRRNDESLSTSERADATEEFEFCSSALEQIAEFEAVLQELGSTSERDFDDGDRERVDELAPKVAAFREETAARIETLERLREVNGEEWFQDTFSDGFWDKVDEWRDEWLDALGELEHACEEYAKPSDEPVEAHLADLFDYFNWRLKGSDHYSSTGILFMTYYFEREGSDLLDEDGEPFGTLTEDEELLASLATGIDDASVLDDEYLQQIAAEEDVDDVDELPPLAEFKALAAEIDDRCQTVDKQIPADWADRALSEITTAGYQPNHKHGVAINITPLAEQDIVPEIVEDKVL